MDLSPKLDHDNVPVFHGNTTIDQTGRYETHLEYYVNNIENEDIFDIFKKPEKVSLCLQLFHWNTNARKKKRKRRKIKKKKKKVEKIQSITSFSGFFSLLCICAHFILILF